MRGSAHWIWSDRKAGSLTGVTQLRLAPLAERLAQRFDSWRASQAGRAVAALESICPSCGATIPSGLGKCTACAADFSQSRVSALYRLIGFARPVAGLIALGFGLTLASTSAGLVPPYLTMPLLDRVLIPYQNGEPADFHLVVWYLSGLACAAVLAWLLDWARLYVLARVSERISADLRTAHLRSPAALVAGVLWRQADRRPDLPGQLRHGTAL